SRMPYWTDMTLREQCMYGLTMLKGVVLVLALQVLTAIAPAVTDSDRVSPGPGHISRLVEERRGGLSCWGVLIHLSNLHFRKSIRRDQILISEGKHGHDLRQIIVWRVDENWSQARS